MLVIHAFSAGCRQWKKNGFVGTSCSGAKCDVIIGGWRKKYAVPTSVLQVNHSRCSNNPPWQVQLFL